MTSRFCLPGTAFVASLLVAPLSTGAAQTSRACWLVTPAEAAQILGRPELASGETMHDDYATCTYSRGDFGVHLNHGRTVASLRQALQEGVRSGKVEAIAGVGDEAGVDKSGKQPSLIAIKGKYVVETRILSSPSKIPSDQIKPRLVKLAQTALSKLAAGSAKTSRACWLITPAEVAQILGKPDLKNGEAIHDDYDDCDYKAAGFDLDMLSYTRAEPRLEGFKTLVQKGHAEAVPNIGDAAILGHDGGNRPTVNVLKGRHEFMITSLDSTRTPADIKPKLIQLAKTAMAKLP